MRYRRAELVIGKDSQSQLKKSKVVIVGCGALGTVAAELLSRSGVGSLTLIDRDIVELSNLQRQTLYSEDDIGNPKAECCFEKLKRINSETKIRVHITDVNHRNIDLLLKDHDLILDCTDNLYSRLLINEFSRKHNIPWIYSAAIRDCGNVMVITKDTPCLRCVFENLDQLESVETCDTVGVLNTITNAIACIEVNEAMKILSKKSEFAERNEQFLISFDINCLRLTKVKTEHKKDCPVCNKRFEYLEGKYERKMQYRCSGVYQFYFENIDINTLASRLKRLGPVKSGDGFVFFENLSAFSNGRAYVKAENEERAKSIISKYIGY